MRSFTHTITKILFFFMILTGWHFPAQAQFNGIDKVISFSGPGNDYVVDMLLERGKRNLYAIGYFQDTMRMGGNDYISNGGYDVFLAKFGPSGELQFGITGGGPNDDYGLAITMDPLKRIWITGSYQSPFTWDGTTFNDSSGFNLFVGVVDTNGNTIHIKNFPGSGSFFPADVLCKGNPADFKCYVGGSGNGNIPTIGIADLMQGEEILLGSFSSNVTPINVATLGGPGDQFMTSMSNNGPRGIGVLGSFTNQIVFIDDTIGSRGGSDIINTEFNETLNSFESFRHLGGDGNDYPGDIITDPKTNDQVITGCFSTVAFFDDTIGTSKGGLDPFVFRIDSNGNRKAFVTGGGPGDDYGNKVRFHRDGLLLVGGSFNGSIGNDAGDTIKAVGQDDVFVAILPQDTNVLGNHFLDDICWGGSKSYDYFHGMAYDDTLNMLVIAGSFRDTMDILGDTVIYNKGGDDAFILFTKADTPAINPPDTNDTTATIRDAALFAAPMIYPNPFTGTLQIQFEHTFTPDQGVDIRLYNQLGDLVHSASLSPNSNGLYTIQPQLEVNGVYWLEWQTPHTMGREKVILLAPR